MQIYLFAVIGTAILISAHPDNKNPFKSSYNLIDEINNDPHSTWTAGVNFDPDLPARYINKLLGLKRLNGSSVLLKGEPINDISDSDIPASFDARKKWKKCKSLQQIRDQSDCGSCWAVSAASAFADRLCIATNGKFNGHISVREVLSCCKTCGDGCDGGYEDRAWRYFKTHGIVTGGDYNSKEGCQPYPLQPCEHHVKGPRPSCPSLDPTPTPGCKTSCTNSQYKAPFVKDHHKVKTAYLVGKSVEEIQKEILKYGPVTAGFSVYDDFLTYKKGVYSPSKKSKELSGHAVKVIGWGVEKKVPYWLVQNSWNYDWGEKGLFKILRGKDICGFESGISAGIPAY